MDAIGIWSTELRFGEAKEVADAAFELEELGFSTLWFPGGRGGPVFDAADAILAATYRVVVAIGIVNIWMHEPAEVAAGYARLSAAHPGRFLLGLGVSHAPVINAIEPGRFRAPVAVMEAYLDALDEASPPVPAEERILAALGPRMCDLARRRSLGAHPYFATVEHTRAARERLGPDAVLAPEVAVVLETDPARAREIARRYTSFYLRLPSYADNLLRHGYSEEDLRDGGSDRLVDGLVAWGDLLAIARRIVEYHEAGADHVGVQVITEHYDLPAMLAGQAPTLPRQEWRNLAYVLR